MQLFKFPHSTFFTLIYIFFLPLTSFSQYTEIEGIVLDASTKESLPAANISIEGTYNGTISNTDGQFSIRVKAFPATLLFRYIGYETQKITLKTKPSSPISVSLKPIAYEMENIEVTGEDPAVYIMRQVIAKKKEWREKLFSFEAEAYTRQVLKNDTGIVSINESISTTYWQVNKGFREVVKAKRQTNNLTAAQNFAGASYVPNFYNDDITISGFNIMGVTHPDAIDTYAFKLEKYRKLDDKVVFDISVRPKNKLATTFKGMISVLDEDYAILEVDLKPNESIIFPPPIREFHLAYKQQFNNFGGDFWLPVDVRISGSILISMMGITIPKIQFDQVSRQSNYKVNVFIPDSLYISRQRLIVDSLRVTTKSDSLFSFKEVMIPLSESEKMAYEGIDSTMTMEKAFKPKGAVGRFLDTEDDENKKKSTGNQFLDKLSNFITPKLWYTRVEGAHIGAEVFYKKNGWKLGVESGYKTHFDFIPLQTELEFRKGIKSNFYEAKLGYQNDVITRNSSLNFNRLMNSGSFLFSGYDFFDYYQSQQFYSSLSVKRALVKARRRRDRVDITYSGILRFDRASSLTKQTDYDVFGFKRIERENGQVLNGNINSLTLSAQIGDNPVPFSPVFENRVKLSIETSQKSVLQSDVNFTRFLLEADYRIHTLFKRRLLPNTLDLRFIAGTSIGDLPPQRLFSLDGSLTGLTPFGGFKTLRNSFIEGNRTMALFWEHNFRTVPFEILGLRSLANRGTSVLLFGGHGKVGQSDNIVSLFPNANYERGVRHEIGISISGIFDLIRLDLAQRLDKPGFTYGVSVSKFF